MKSNYSTSHLSACVPLLILALALKLAAAESLKVTGLADPSQLIPIALEGYSGEVLSALKFDLEVAGFKITRADEALLQVSGGNNPHVIGRVMDRNRTSLLA